MTVGSSCAIMVPRPRDFHSVTRSLKFSLDTRKDNRSFYFRSYEDNFLATGRFGGTFRKHPEY